VVLPGLCNHLEFYIKKGGHHGRDRMVVGFTTTCAISAYHHLSCACEPRSHQGVLDTTLYDQVVSDLQDGGFLRVSSTNKNEILLKVALNTINNKTNIKKASTVLTDTYFMYHTK
jgi:hypothetical protein